MNWNFVNFNNVLGIKKCYKKSKIMFGKFGAVVVAQLAEWSLPILELHGSSPVTGKIL